MTPRRRYRIRLLTLLTLIIHTPRNRDLRHSSLFIELDACGRRWTANIERRP